MKHEMNLNDEQFKKIKEGTKTVELRLYDVKRKALNVGDTIEFNNRATNEKIDVLVIGLKTYPNFEELYKNYEGISMGYEKDDIKNPEDMYKYYSKDEIKKYGTLAIEMKLL